MDEQAIRTLEAATAKAMGWDCTRGFRDGVHTGIFETWVGPEGRTERYACVDGGPPRFARDPAAVLEALTWICSLTELYGSGFYDASIRCFDNRWFALADKVGERNRRVIAEGETMGVCICKAIIAIQTTEEE